MGSSKSGNFSTGPRAVLREYLESRKDNPPKLSEIAAALHRDIHYVAGVVSHAVEAGVVKPIHAKSRLRADRTFILGTLQPRHFHNRYCPTCASKDVRKLTHDGWRCNSCREQFDNPRVDGEKSKRSNGSGQIATLTWRHQLARDILAQHERDKASVGERNKVVYGRKAAA